MLLYVKSIFCFIHSITTTKVFHINTGHTLLASSITGTGCSLANITFWLTSCNHCGNKDMIKLQISIAWQQEFIIIIYSRCSFTIEGNILTFNTDSNDAGLNE